MTEHPAVWSTELDEFADAFDGYLDALTAAETACKQNALRYAETGFTRLLDLATHARGIAAGLHVARQTALVSFRPFIGRLLVDAVIDVVDEDRCGADT